MWYAAANTFGLTLRLSGGYDDDQKFTTPSKAKRETLFEVQNSYTLAIVYRGKGLKRLVVRLFLTKIFTKHWRVRIFRYNLKVVITCHKVSDKHKIIA